MNPNSEQRNDTQWQAPKLTPLGGADDSEKRFHPNERTNAEGASGPGS